MTTAFDRVIAVPGALASVPFAGQTDRRIIRSGLLAVEAFEDEGLIDAVLDEYLDVLPEEIAASKAYGPHAGVVELIDALDRHPGACVGLGTGNVEAGARLKLGPLGLSQRFAFGGFGCDAEERAELLRIGAERGAAILGVEVGECRVVVIGDTPFDVSAAFDIRAACLAVATGPYSAAELEAVKPNLVVARLDDPAALEFLCAG